MIIDAVEIETGQAPQYDLCIIGGGMAGITLAREFRSTPGTRICVLESGSDRPEAATQALYSGSAWLEGPAGQARLIDRYLVESRYRVLGGSGNAWGARCAVLDPVDFDARTWIPGSGWPFSRRDLDPYYHRAGAVLHIPDFSYDPSTPFDPDRPPFRIGHGQRFTTVTRHVSPLRRLREENLYWLTRKGRPMPSTVLRGEYGDFIQSITRARHIDVYVHANVVEIQTDSTGSAVQAVQVATLHGNRFQVRARCFVLATGGIENVRLLLASNAVHQNGLGNAHDLVGRYFSGHFSFVANSSLALSQRPSSLALYKGRGRQAVLGHWAMHKAVQSEFGLPNFGVGLYSNRRALSRLDRDVALAAAVTDAGLRSPPPDQHSVTERSSPLYFLIEQVLNPESRITLSSAKDALGMPKVTLVWRFLPRDFDGLREGVGLFARELGRTSQGRVRTMVHDVNFVQHFRLARHHIGATRMHSNPKRGVVNPDCRVHSLGNLYIAGSSVFPTPGVVNPTLTILALALRLADHLKIRLKKGT